MGYFIAGVALEVGIKVKKIPAFSRPLKYVSLDAFTLKVTGVGSENEVINLYSNQQQGAVRSLDAILSCPHRRGE